MQFDFLPLQSSVSVNDFFRRLKTSNKRIRVGFWVIVTVAVVLGGLGVFLSITPNVPDSDGANYVLLGFSVATFASLVGVYHRIRTSIRLERFAHRNNLSFINESFGRDYAATPFYGGAVRILDGLRTSNQLFYEFGNLALLQNEQIEIGYVRIKLPNELPNIVLQAKNNFSVSENLYLDQRLSLEGDFDDYFTLYAPKKYERDALYLFTPDVMVRFIETLGQFNCEIARDELTFFSKQSFKLTDQKQITLILEAAKTMTDKIDRQFSRYSDRRLQQTTAYSTVSHQPSQIAAGGQRLKSFSLATQIVFIAISNTFSLALIIGAIYYSTRVDYGFAATLRTVASVGVASLIASIIGTIKVLQNMRNK